MKILFCTFFFAMLTASEATAQNDQIYSDRQAKEQIQFIYSRLKKGDTFEGLARNYSQDITSRMKGGDIGWTNPGQLVEVYEKAVRKLKVNQFTKPFKSEFGYHVAQLIDKKGNQIRTRHIIIKFK